MSTTVSDPKPSADGKCSVRVVKRNRRRYGEIRCYRNGATRLNVYWLPRRTDDYQRTTEAWAVDVESVEAVRPYGVTHVGLEVEDGTRLLTAIGVFGFAGKEQGVIVKKHRVGNRGEHRWHVPERLWSVRRPPEDQREEALLERMRIRGKR